jgi:phosphoribosylformylglycinamidine synthase subunit PurS
MKVRVTVMLKEGVLDPQGKAIGHALGTLGFAELGEVRCGKVIDLDVPANDAGAAVTQGEAMARALLANDVIEDFSVEALA